MIDDETLSTWAKAQAEDMAPDTHWSEAGAWGVLYLAERLQDPDVLAILEDEFMDFEDAVRSGVSLGYGNWAKDAITAILTWIVEGDNE